MADEQTQSEMDTEETTQPDGGEDSQTVQAPDVSEMERMRAALKKANAEAKQYRLKVQEVETAQQAAERAQLEQKEEYKTLYEQRQAELEAAQQRISEMEQRSKADAITRALTAEAHSLGFTDPADVERFIDLDAVELDEDGKPTNAGALVKTLSSQKPYLLNKQAPPNTNSGTGGAGVSQNGVMSDEEKQELAAVLGVDARYL